MARDCAARSLDGTDLAALRVRGRPRGQRGGGEGAAGSSRPLGVFIAVLWCFPVLFNAVQVKAAPLECHAAGGAGRPSAPLPRSAALSHRRCLVYFYLFIFFFWGTLRRRRGKS